MANEIKFILNNNFVTTSSHPGTVLLDVIRNQERLTGTKEGCREGDCGACTVLLGELKDDEVVYKTVNSCLYPIGNIDGKHIVTIEGLNIGSMNLVQNAFLDEAASQCGFCTPGFLISATSYLMNNIELDLDEMIDAIAGNICRCTGYISIKKSLEQIISNIQIQSNHTSQINKLVKTKVLPDYFLTIRDMLNELHGGKSKKSVSSGKFIIGGGTDLYIQIPDEILNYDASFSNVLLKDGISESDGVIKISGNATFEQMNQSPLIRRVIPDIGVHMRLIASLPIRNSATVAGNIINASPIGDVTIMLLALNAELIFEGSGGERKILLADFYKAYKTFDKKEDEILTWIEFKISGDSSKFNFEKVSKRTHLDIASVNSAVSINYSNDGIESAAIAMGGIAPVPLLLKSTNEYLLNKKISSDIIESAIEVAQEEISPISDIRGSEEYKRLLAGQMIKAHFIKLFPELIEVEELI